MLRFADSLDHYGTTADMLAGAWAELSGVSISTAHARTGANACLLSGGGGSTARMVIPGPALDVAGYGFGSYLPSLPDTNNYVYSWLKSAANVPIITLVFQSNGSIDIKKGDQNGTLIESTDALLTAGTFHHIEFRAFIDDVAGEIELHVNGVPQIQLDSLNLGTTPISQIGWKRNSSPSLPSWYIDDIFVWDEQGDFNNSFLGPLRILTTFADGDGSPQDWTVVGAGSAYQAVDEIPSDGDTSYIGAGSTGDKCTLSMPEIPSEVDIVSGVYVPALARIDEAGTGSILVSMLSGADTLAGGESTPLTTEYTYWPFTFDYNPNTDTQWTKASFEAATIQIEKTV